MEGLSEILNKLSVEDIEKMRLLFSIGADTKTKEVITLRVFCEEYINLIRSNRSKNYFKSVNISLQHLTNYFGAQRSIGSITLKDIELFIIHLQKKVPKGFRVYYRNFKAAFNKALDWNYIELNHFVKVKLPKKNKLNPLFLNATEVNKIIQNIDVVIVKAVIVFAYNTGMRISEIVNLKWRNVAFEKKIITVGDEDFTTKGKNQRYIPISDEVAEILKGRSKKTEVRIQNNDLITKNVGTGKETKDSSSVSLLRNDKQNYVFAKSNGESFRQVCKLA